MRTRDFLLGAALLAVGAHATAKPPEDKGPGRKGSPPSAAEHAPGQKAGGPRFGDHERVVIERYFRDNPGARSELPPGLAKQDKIPPGWQKKLSPGARVPDEVWEHRVPLPGEVIVKLPTPPPGVTTVRIHDRIVRVHERNREVLDTFPLPRP